MSNSLCPLVTAASPLSNHACAGLPRYKKSPYIATRIVTRRALPRKFSSTPHRQQRRKPDLLGLDLVVAASAVPQHSPQNTEDPLVGPTPSLTATEAVEVQLRALEDDDTPWPGHGVQTGEQRGGSRVSFERRRRRPFLLSTFSSPPPLSLSLENLKQ